MDYFLLQQELIDCGYHVKNVNHKMFIYMNKRSAKIHATIDTRNNKVHYHTDNPQLIRIINHVSNQLFLNFE